MQSLGNGIHSGMKESVANVCSTAKDTVGLLALCFTFILTVLIVTVASFYFLSRYENGGFWIRVICALCPAAGALYCGVYKLSCMCELEILSSLLRKIYKQSDTVAEEPMVPWPLQNATNHANALNYECLYKIPTPEGWVYCEPTGYNYVTEERSSGTEQHSNPGD